MAIVISVVNLKGGCGKTTLATNLAEVLTRRGYRILLGDLDEGQNSAYLWSTLNDDLHFSCKPVAHESLEVFVLRHSDEFDVIIIDSPPHVARATGHAIRLSDICLCPVAPSPIELWRLKTTIDLIKDRQALSGRLPLARVVLSRAKRNTKLVPKAIRVLNEFGVEPLESGTTDLQAFQQAMEYGETIFGDIADLTNPKAAQELMNKIGDDVVELIREATKTGEKE